MISSLVEMKIPTAHRHIALPSSFDFVETEGTVLGWRWVLLDRRVRTQPVTPFYQHSRLIKSYAFFIYFKF
jgi:hypothetical protein